MGKTPLENLLYKKIKNIEIQNRCIQYSFNHDIGDPKGNRTLVLAVRGLRPRPLDDGGSTDLFYHKKSGNAVKLVISLSFRDKDQELKKNRLLMKPVCER